MGEITTLEELDALDQKEMVLGYMCEETLPPDGATRSFLHGWLNRQVDLGKMEPSDAQKKLAQQIVARHRANLQSGKAG